MSDQGLRMKDAGEDLLHLTVIPYGSLAHDIGNPPFGHATASANSPAPRER
jgi:dGTP triphosphohydrolase